MGSITDDRCRFLLEKMVDLGVKPGTRIPRSKWDRILMRGLKLSYASARNVTKEGEMLGYWTRHPHVQTREGMVEISAP